MDLINVLEVWESTDKLVERIGRWLNGAQNGLPILNDELDAVALLYSKSAADFDGYGDLSFAADRAGSGIFTCLP